MPPTISSATAPPRAPEGVRFYVIGDVHGRSDLLDLLHAKIAADLSSHPHAGRNEIVYLGDYIDRGPDSCGVLERLSDAPPPECRATCLMGNHEAMMLRFLEKPSAGPHWLANGGIETLQSYGVRLTGRFYERAGLQALQEAWSAALPQAHRDFVRALPLTHRAGDYLFVHAGIRPGVPLAEQAPEDLLWIRESFLDSADPHGFVVVHGHTPSSRPEERPNRIGIDTGAFASGRLTCLVLHDDSRRFLSTA